MGRFGVIELLIIGMVLLLFFGNRLPEAGKSLGNFIREFKKAMEGSHGPHSSSSSPVPATESSPAVRKKRVKVAKKIK